MCGSKSRVKNVHKGQTISNNSTTLLLFCAYCLQFHREHSVFSAHFRWTSQALSAHCLSRLCVFWYTNRDGKTTSKIFLPETFLYRKYLQYQVKLLTSIFFILIEFIALFRGTTTSRSNGRIWNIPTHILFKGSFKECCCASTKRTNWLSSLYWRVFRHLSLVTPLLRPVKQFWCVF